MLYGIGVSPDGIDAAYFDIVFEMPAYQANEMVSDRVRADFKVHIITNNGRTFVGTVRDEVIMQS
jgi:hypothetical protein